jgi:3-oxoacyl-[acyl-carrier-protein] synthase-3
MTTHRLRLHAATLELPTTTDVLSAAVAEGRLRGRHPDVDPATTLPVTGGSPVDLAAAAARTVLARTGHPAAEIEDLYYAWTYFQGAHFWSPAHALADRAGLSANPIGLQQMCNGGAAAVHLADRVARAGAPFTALICTGDAFRGPGFDRWSGDYGVLYGDAGTAVLAVSSAHPAPVGGPASTLVSLHTGALPHLESMHRPVDAPADIAPAGSWPVDVQATKRRYLQEHGSEALAEAMRGMVGKLLAKVLSDLAGQDLTANGKVYLPRLMNATLDSLYAPAVAALTDLPQRRLGDATGHLGAGDLIANLADAQASANAPRIDIFISAGAGFTISIAALESFS